MRCSLIGDMDRAYGPQAGLELVEALGELRREGRAERVIGIGGDSTETSHSDGAVRAGLRMAATVLGQRVTVGAS